LTYNFAETVYEPTLVQNNNITTDQSNPETPAFVNGDTSLENGFPSLGNYVEGDLDFFSPFSPGLFLEAYPNFGYGSSPLVTYTQWSYEC